MEEKPPTLLMLKAHRAFTLLELLASMALVSLIAGLTLSILNSTTGVWNRHKVNVTAYGDARVIFETVAQRTAQATLNAYWDYDDRQAPQRYLRRSELHFSLGRADQLIPAVPGTSTSAIFFTAPLGISKDQGKAELVRMLSACGFYIKFGRQEDRPPFIDTRLPNRYRYRLYQLLQPGEELSVYAPNIDPNAWFSSAVANWSFPLAENVIGLIIRARYPSGNGTLESYTYDSRATASIPPPTLNQLPPVISLTLIILDENTAGRLEREYSDQPPPILPDTGAFSDTANFQTDLEAWEGKLKSMNLGYRVFSTDVYIRGAKWSSM